MYKVQKQKGITLISLVITIVILIILSAVAIYLGLGNNGIFNKAEQAKNETIKQTATEKMNLKITNMQIETYAKEQRMPTLQEFSDGLCEDDEIQYVELQSKKVGNLSKIEVGEASSIFTKLKQYPYEFEINSSLQLASIDGVSTDSTNSDGCKYTVISDAAKDIITYTDEKYKIDLNVLFNDKNYSDYISRSENTINYIINNSDILDEAINSNYLMPSILSSENKNLALSKLSEKCITNPQLTSITGSDGGNCFGTPPYPDFGYQLWYAFNENEQYAYQGIGTFYLGYKFPNKIWCFKISFKQRSTIEGVDNIVVQYSDDNDIWYSATGTITTNKDDNVQEYILDNAVGKHLYWRITGNGYGQNGGISNLKFYGIQ